MSCKIKTCYQTKLPETSLYFKEVTISENLSIPVQKPDIEHILDVIIWPEIEDYRAIETEIGKSYEGQYLTGVKLIVEVKLKEKVTYVADKEDQPVHSAHFETLKSIFVILPEEVDGKKTCDLVAAKAISVVPYVETVHAKMIDKRTLHKCVLLLIDVKIC